MHAAAYRGGGNVILALRKAIDDERAVGTIICGRSRDIIKCRAKTPRSRRPPFRRFTTVPLSQANVLVFTQAGPGTCSMPLGGSENDIGADCNPKGVVADKGDFDEYPHNCEPRKNERERKSKIHYAPPMRYNKKIKLAVQRSRSHTIARGTKHLRQDR